MLFSSKHWRCGVRFFISTSFVFYLIVFPTHSSTQSTAHTFFFTASDSLFQIGEDLIYNVSYATIDIGQVRVKLVNKFSKDQLTYYKATAYIDSYKGLPFVNVHSVYESTMPETIYSTWFRARTKIKDRWIAFEYNYDYPNHALHINESIWETNKIVKRDTLYMDTLYQDGLSLFYFARQQVLQRQEISIPSIISEKMGITSINFMVERTKEKIDAVDYPIDVVHFEGEAGWVGVFGLTGHFEGWFSNDAARVPILAKMKVIIGNIRIELMKWTRQGWTPPRYVEEKSR
ncbi:MAG: DUF3108 domain-containing protein [Ignavibacteriae bacterium]|nr:DUF3108 domain-containing protein [Ignavibacteriota bacterium]